MILIPIKDPLYTKTRLKSALPLEYTTTIDKLVELCFINTILMLKKIPCSFGVVSPSLSILKRIRKNGAVFTYQDTGINLNTALSNAIQKIPRKQPLLIIMPDLPFLNQVFFHTLFKEIENTDIVIIPSLSQNNDFGTAALYMREPDLLEFDFGKNSSHRFQNKAASKGFRYKTLDLVPYNRDLDTLDDVKYLERHLNQVFEPEMYSEILNQIDFDII